MACHEQWPVAKLQVALRRLEANRPHKFAVILSTGAMNPVHLAHIQMLHKGRERLEEAGYTVVGAWISPSHDGYVQPKAKTMQTIGLSDKFRLEVARRVSLEDPLVSVGSWEAEKEGHWPDFPVVCKALAKDLRTSVESEMKCLSEVEVFYVCGADHAVKCDILRGLDPCRGIGVVVVPRPGQDLPELPEDSDEDLVFIAKPVDGDLTNLSSSKIRDALERLDLKFVKSAMGEVASRFLLDPNQHEFEHYAADFDLLRFGSTAEQREAALRV